MAHVLTNDDGLVSWEAVGSNILRQLNGRLTNNDEGSTAEVGCKGSSAGSFPFFW
jgi:hypothetical protein